MVEWAAANGSITPLDAISTLEGRSDGSAKTASVYVSITGLQLKAKRHQIKFGWHAIRSMNQARSAAENIVTKARSSTESTTP